MEGLPPAPAMPGDDRPRREAQDREPNEPTRIGAWRERFWRWRDRLVSDPRFQRWATDFPLTRPMARRRSAELFDLCAGFLFSQTLLACVRLDLLTYLKDGPRSIQVIARAVGVPQESAVRLLEAASGLKLLARRSGGYGLGELGAALLANPGVTAMVAHHAMVYRDFADPVALLRGEVGTELSQYWGYARAPQGAALEAQDVAAYSRLMNSSQALIAGEILAAWPLKRYRRLLDIGGGEGAFAIAAARAHPSLRVAVADLPAVAARARTRFAEVGLTARAQAYGLDFFIDDLPKGYDAVSLIRVLHDHNDAQARALLRRAATALAPGGVLILAEPMAGVRGAERMGETYFNLYLFAMGRGRPRTRGELRRFLAEAGFVRVRHVATGNPLMTSLLVARQPG